MKTLRKMTSAALLACVLTVSASAGDIHAPGATPPPPDPPPTSSTASEETDESGGDLTELIAALLNGVLSVL